MDFYRHLIAKGFFGRNISFTLVHIISIIFTFQTMVTAYSSSTYLERFILPEFVGLVFAVAAFLSLLLTLFLPKLLNAIGNVNTTILLMCFIIISLVLTGMSINPLITISSFIFFTALSPLIYLNIDIFLESLIGNTEGATGTKRGLVLTLMSLASFLSPLAMGHIIGSSNNLSGVYYVGAVVGLVYIAFILSKFRLFVDPIYTKVSLRNLFKETLRNKNINTVLTTQFILQFFFTWTIVYFPLHMSQTAGFNWEQIGIITASGLLAYVIFEYPIGFLADNKFGEKEMMALGFAIIAITSASLSFLSLAGIGSWMIVMFINRLGASLVEVTNESYFFKQVTEHDSNLISLFRLMRPLANLLGALIGSVSLFIMPINYIFIVLAIIMIAGAFMTQRLVDTR